MSRSIDQIQDIFFSFIIILHLNGMTLDRNASFTLQVHIVQNLRLQIFTFYCLGILKQTVGQSTFTMVNMSNNTIIADILHLLNLFRCAKIVNLG